MKKIAIFILLLIVILSCNSNDNETLVPTSSCNENAQIETETNFNSIETNNYVIQNVVLTNNCLAITLSSSGCNAVNWDMNLFSHNNFTAVYPLQRFAKIELINNEMCLAVFSKTISFDLTPYQVQNQNQVTINLEGWNEPIVYTY